MDEIAAYANAQEIRDVGLDELADAVETFGVPQEHIHFVDNEVVIILGIDYEEGRAKPLVKRSVWFLDVMQALIGRVELGMSWRYRDILVKPDGTWITKAAGERHLPWRTA
jgi:hypothetical protein